MNGHEVGLIKEKVLTFLPEFEVMIGGHSCGIIKKKFTFFHPQYELDYNGWHVEGDFLSWNYDVYEACSAVIHITKEPLHWGDTYVIDFLDPKDELMGLMLVLANAHISSTFFSFNKRRTNSRPSPPVAPVTMAILLTFIASISPLNNVYSNTFSQNKFTILTLLLEIPFSLSV